MTTSVDTRTHDTLIAQATDLAYNHQSMMGDLVQLRKTRGLTPKEVAKRLGVKESTIKNFEHYDSDPTLSMIRRYALVVGAKIDHNIEAS